MRAENISIEEVEWVLLQGDRIEDYPDDPRGASYLMLGFPNGRPIHVCASDKGIDTNPFTFVITVYEPNLSKRVFEDDYRTRIMRS